MVQGNDVLNGLLRNFYKILSWILGWVIPKDPNLLIVGGRQFGGNTKPLLENGYKYGLRVVWLTKRAEILNLNRENIVSSQSMQGVWLAARASRVAFTHALGDFKPVRFSHPKVKFYNLWHGMPVKKISTLDPGFWLRKHAKSDVREMRRYAGMFVTSPAMAEAFQKTFGLSPANVYITGQARTDSLVCGEVLPIDHLFDPPLPKGHRKILYAPTWREGSPVRLFPFDDLNLQNLQSELEVLNAVIYVRTHPNDPGRWSKRDSRIVPLQGDIVPEVTDVLRNFNVLVTDFSGIFYDFLLIDRPTIFLPYDLEEYSRSPGFYLPFEETSAGPKPKTQTEFICELKRLFNDQDHYISDRQRVRNQLHSFVDDCATSRILEVIKKGD